MHWDSIAYDKNNCAVNGTELVEQGIGIALLMIKIIGQCIGIKLAYDKHSCAVHWN